MNEMLVDAFKKMALIMTSCFWKVIPGFEHDTIL